MAKKTFKCPKCDRSFSMAAHLARHKNTIHATAKQKAAAMKKAKRSTKKTVKRTSRPKGVAARVGLSRMGMEDLTDLIAAARQEATRRLAELKKKIG